ncbi:alkaline phosphatase family protein [Corallincola platygyrae]|uniref:Alkaline phosphatase family protein n=1 Tax=Corallincola platygyrae TaxID=1193278 RepID=A0ABW4XI62_9GAMM
MAKLIVFIDGYPFGHIEKLKELPFLKSFGAMKPSFGYSVNLHHELFQGTNPETLGFFGDMKRVGDKTPLRRKKFHLLFDWTRQKFPFLSRILYKVLARTVGLNIAFMPISIASKFTKQGSYLLQVNERVEIGEHEYKVICYDRELPFGSRDEKVFKDTLEQIDQGSDRILAAFTELDWLLHKQGVSSEAHTKKNSLLNDALKEMHSRFVKKFPDGEIVIVSDHGMINSHTSVDFRLEEKFGLPFSNGVSYFYDSLYIHLWNDGNSEEYSKIKSFLSNQNQGKFITAEERKKYRIDSSEFGDDIYCLEPGYGFSPNYFGYGLLKAYHGYNPSVEEGWGVICSSREGSIDGTYETSDVYNYLSNGGRV